MREIVIFGTGEIAELADYYFSRDSAFKVAGFTVDAGFLKETSFSGRPIVPFEEGLALTIGWYQENQDWVKRVRSGEYQNYYESNYANR